MRRFSTVLVVLSLAFGFGCSSSAGQTARTAILGALDMLCAARPMIRPALESIDAGTTPTVDADSRE